MPAITSPESWGAAQRARVARGAAKPSSPSAKHGALRQGRAHDSYMRAAITRRAMALCGLAAALVALGVYISGLLNRSPHVVSHVRDAGALESLRQFVQHRTGEVFLLAPGGDGCQRGQFNNDSFNFRDVRRVSCSEAIPEKPSFEQGQRLHALRDAFRR
jgi:hypothetical protein